MSAWRRMFDCATDAPMSYRESAGLMCLATFAQGKRHIQAGRAGVKPNLFMMVVGPSSVSRKTTTVQLAEAMVRDCDQALVGPKDYTMEGLLRWMSKEDRIRNRFTLFADEFGSDLARGFAYAPTMKEDFCRLYDGDDWSKVRATGKEFTISKPRIGLYAAAAYPMLSKFLKTDDWFSGFMMRFLFIAPVGTQEPKDIQPVFPQEEWNEALALMLQIRDALEARSYSLSMSKGAAQLYSETMRGLKDQATSNHLLDVYLGRFGVSIQKLSLLYQIDSDPYATDISPEAMREAVQFAEGVCWSSFVEAFRVTSASDWTASLQRLADQVFEAGEDGLSVPKLFSVGSANRSLTQMVAYLKNGNLVQERRIDGEPRLFWLHDERMQSH